jgi:hypothetical protein
VLPLRSTEWASGVSRRQSPEWSASRRLIQRGAGRILNSSDRRHRKELELDNHEKLIAAFDSMNAWAQALILDLAEGYAQDFQGAKPPPASDSVQSSTRKEVSKEGH